MQRKIKFVLVSSLIVIILLAAAACGGQEPAGPDEDIDLPDGEVESHHLTVANLIDEWNEQVAKLAATADDDLYQLTNLHFADLGGTTLQVHHAWAELEPGAPVQLTAFTKGVEGGLQRIIIHSPTAALPREPDAQWRPFYEILLAVTNPALSDGQRAELKDQLQLNDAAQDLVEAAGATAPPTATSNRVHYVVTAGQDAQRNDIVALVATLTAQCDLEEPFAPCS